MDAGGVLQRLLLWIRRSTIATIVDDALMGGAAGDSDLNGSGVTVSRNSFNLNTKSRVPAIDSATSESSSICFIRVARVD